uniref:acid phosphatase n=1 Tax=Angiostrongylus cantonensis TaxID=6313 RepID=A0A0K0DEC3_ANGCA
MVSFHATFEPAHNAKLEYLGGNDSATPFHSSEQRTNHLARIRCPFVVDEMKQITGVTDQSVDLQHILDELFAQEAKRLNFTNIVGKDRIRQFEPIFLEHDSGLAVPQWFNDDARKEADHLLDLTIEFISGTGRFHNPNWILTRSGKLLYTILNNQRKAVENALNGTKFFGFTTHDILISPLLDSMGVLHVALAPKGRPDFVATVVFELWRNDTQHYVKVLNRRNTEYNEFTNLTPMIKSCGGGNACDIKVFEEAVRTFQIEHPEVLCDEPNIKQDSDRNNGIPGEHLLDLIYGKPMKIGYHLVLASSVQ